MESNELGCGTVTHVAIVNSPHTEELSLLFRLTSQWPVWRRPASPTDYTRLNTSAKLLLRLLIVHSIVT